MFEGLQSPSNSQDEVKGTVGMEKWGLLFGKAPGNLGILGVMQGIQRHHHQDCLRFQELGIYRTMQGLPEIMNPKPTAGAKSFLVNIGVAGFVGLAWIKTLQKGP